MADFDPTQIPELVSARLDAVATDTSNQAQQMFSLALEDQRKLLAALVAPGLAVAAGTAERAGQLAEPPGEDLDHSPPWPDCSPP